MKSVSLVHQYPWLFNLEILNHLIQNKNEYCMEVKKDGCYQVTAF